MVGESGCGKSTMGRVVLNLLEPTSGQVFIDGQEMYKLHGAAQKTMRMRAQMIFQDPYSSLNPRMSVSEIIAEPLIANKLMTDKRFRDEWNSLWRRLAWPSVLLTPIPMSWTAAAARESV